MLTVALIPLRGGSKGIPGKNIKEMAGKPLCHWVIGAARESGIFDRVVASTDCEQIGEIAAQAGAEILWRLAELATDTASTESVMLHAAENYQFDVLTTIQATSPLTTAQDLKEAYMQFVKYKLGSLFTGTRVKKFFWDEEMHPLNYYPPMRPMRQEWDGTICETGAFYFTKREILKSRKCRLGGKIGCYEMPQGIDIDTMDDWKQAENALLFRKGQLI